MCVYGMGLGSLGCMLDSKKIVMLYLVFFFPNLVGFFTECFKVL